MMLKKLLNTDFSEVEFTLEFQEPFALQQEMVLRLRREFLHLARQTAIEMPEQAARLMAMLDPALSTDSYARRLFQKPAPPFIIRPPTDNVRKVAAGDQFRLEVGFLGNPGGLVPLFAGLLSSLGAIGISQGGGRYRLAGVVGKDQSGNRYPITIPADPDAQPVMPQTSLAWLVEERLPLDRNFRINFLTPARLLSQTKPLFRISFAEIFPFMLRRVSSMLHAWGSVELFENPQSLIDTAARVEADARHLCWQDWRTLEGDCFDQDLGGIAGYLDFAAPVSDEIGMVLTLAQLFNIGKSAAYGCGAFEIGESD